MPDSALTTQVVGNVGLYYVSYRLSQLGWNVMPTARNARGVDLLAYSEDASFVRTVQVKSLSRRSPVALGRTLDSLLANFVVICREALSEQPECFVLTSREVKHLAARSEKDGKVAYWLGPRDYEASCYRERWTGIGKRSPRFAIPRQAVG